MYYKNVLKLGILYKNGDIVNHRSFCKILFNPILRYFGYYIGNEFICSSNNLTSLNNTTKFEALSALVSLGFDRKSVEKVIDAIYTENATVETLIREGLKKL